MGVGKKGGDSGIYIFELKIVIKIMVIFSIVSKFHVQAMKQNEFDDLIYF